jgi:hypothetical protein
MYTLKNKTEYKNIPVSTSLLHDKNYINLLKVKHRSLSDKVSEKNKPIRKPLQNQ